ncbi:MAG: GNAT family N-acetyltransferase [Sulfobacillus sp.]
MTIHIRQMTTEDIENVFEVFEKHDIGKSLDYLSECWEENKKGDRLTLVAFYDGQFAGSLHLLIKSYYPYFVEKGIPEINDFNVIPPLRRLGIGNALMDAVEGIAIKKYGVVGVGVGLFESYGNAQRLYARRGYIPDGRGLTYNGEPVTQGSSVRVDHNLALYMTKP